MPEFIPRPRRFEDIAMEAIRTKYGGITSGALSAIQGLSQGIGGMIEKKQKQKEWEKYTIPINDEFLGTLPDELKTKLSPLKGKSIPISDFLSLATKKEPEQKFTATEELKKIYPFLEVGKEYIASDIEKLGKVYYQATKPTPTLITLSPEEQKKWGVSQMTVDEYTKVKGLDIKDKYYSKISQMAQQKAGEVPKEIAGIIDDVMKMGLNIQNIVSGIDVDDEENVNYINQQIENYNNYAKQINASNSKLKFEILEPIKKGNEGDKEKIYTKISNFLKSLKSSILPKKEETTKKTKEKITQDEFNQLKAMGTSEKEILDKYEVIK
jgi:hypothetical protein